MLERYPSERRRKGRLRNSWMQEVTTGMREGNYEYGMNRQGRRGKRNRTLRTDKCENIDILCINEKRFYF